jgi:tetratricopeptide (TPR) repeat protein
MRRVVTGHDADASVASLALAGLMVTCLSGVARAQGPGECSGVDCAPRGGVATTTPVALPQLWRTAGELHALKLRFVEALQAFIRAQVGAFGDEADAVAAAIAAMRTALGVWDAGVSAFDTATRRLPVSAELHVVRGTVFLDRHRLDDATRELSAAARLDAERADVPSLLALAHAAASRPIDALRAARRAADRDPSSVVLAYQHAHLSGALGEADEMARALARVRELTRSVSDPSRGPEAQVAPFERVSLLRQAAGVAPLFPLSIYAAGFAALERGDVTRAIDAFDQARARDPMVHTTPALREAISRAAGAMREAARRDGAAAEALVELERVVREVPGSAEAHRALATALFVRGDDRAVLHAAVGSRAPDAGSCARGRRQVGRRRAAPGARPGQCADARRRSRAGRGARRAWQRGGTGRGSGRVGGPARASGA